MEKIHKKKDTLSWIDAPSQPVFWRIPELGLSGHVIALSAVGFKLSLPAPAKIPPSEGSLTLLYSSTGLEGTLRGSLDSDPDPIFFIDQAQSSAELFSLLSRVRKIQHIDLCAGQDVEAADRFHGFSSFNFVHQSFSGLGEEDLELRSEFLGRNFSFPFFICGMTGGVEKGAEINRRLALAAQELGIPMGIGSQRMALEHENYTPIFKVKSYAPNLFLVGNVGASQLLDQSAVDFCQRAVDMIDANALAIHLNLVQECLQVEGKVAFKNFSKQLSRICEKLSVPVIVKEVGSGISPECADVLVKSGVAAIDIAGRGGTSWPYIEGLRSLDERRRRLGDLFRDWGIPTAYSLRAVRLSQKTCPLIASGGMREGLTAAKALALGADLVGIGLPLMRAALISEEAVIEELQFFIDGLKIAMLATGSQTPKDLKAKLCLGFPFAGPQGGAAFTE